MVIFGGRDINSVDLNDTYELDLNTSPAVWSKPLLSANPLPRWRSTAIYHPGRKRMVIFGGMRGSEPTDEIWELELNSSTLNNKRWTRIFPAGTVAADLARTGHIGVYDSQNDRLIVYGGWSPVNSLTKTYYNSTYAFSFADRQWTLVAPGPDVPAARRNAGAVYDTANDRMIIFGGAFGSDTALQIYNDTYALYSETKWSPTSGKSDVYNYPNPFNSSSTKTKIKFYCDSAQEVKIAIYSLIGELVKDWTIHGVKGINSLEWDGANGDGKKVESGGYICVVNKSGTKSKSKLGIVR
jgi:hypothetical protein